MKNLMIFGIKKAYDDDYVSPDLYLLFNDSDVAAMIQAITTEVFVEQPVTGYPDLKVFKPNPSFKDIYFCFEGDETFSDVYSFEQFLNDMEAQMMDKEMDAEGLHLWFDFTKEERRKVFYRKQYIFETRAAKLAEQKEAETKAQYITFLNLKKEFGEPLTYEQEIFLEANA